MQRGHPIDRYEPDELADHAAVQINDTHPSMVIPELIRLLVEKGLTMDEAIRVQPVRPVAVRAGNRDIP